MAGTTSSCHWPQSSVPMLDMLAEVASATLKSDPILSKKSGLMSPSRNNIKTKISPKKPSNQCEELTLDQIRVLSEKTLLEMFAELTCDEIRRNYSYQCYLIPDKCSQVFTSFGNENKAQLQMKSHLLMHVAELLTEINACSISAKSKFTAEPLHVRKKRLQDGESKRRKRQKHYSILGKRVVTPVKHFGIATKDKCRISQAMQAGDIQVEKLDKFESPPTKGCKKDGVVNIKVENTGIFTALQKPNPQSLADTKDMLPMKNNIKNNYLKSSCSQLAGRKFTLKAKVGNRCSSKLPSKSVDIPKLLCTSHFVKMKRKGKGSSSFSVCKKRKLVRHGLCAKQSEDRADDSGKERDCFGKEDDLKVVVKHETRRQLVADAVTCSVNTLEQPHHDHCYTGPSGKKNGIDMLHVDFITSSDEELSDDDDSKDLLSQSQSVITTPSFPFVYVPLLPNIAQVLEVQSTEAAELAFLVPEGTSTESNCSTSSSTSRNSSRSDDSCFDRVTGHSKHTRLRRVNRVIVPEELEPDSDEDSENVWGMQFKEEASLQYEGAVIESIPYQIVGSCKKEKKCTYDEEGSPEWEKKLALKCIRALRTKKKEDRGPLICKICKNKAFTAQATLMYHYRSHAGIKPFNCTVCGATFTRQHSLNYHMLIHNNKSRFVCTDCGRNFRHPSHYKEHLRRHTGETPYECGDCSLRFKTRNTYKRHLKTRHGKILTAQGIVTLSVEEFYKVRTNPRRKPAISNSSSKLSVEKKDQETQWPECPPYSSLHCVETILVETVS